MTTFVPITKAVQKRSVQYQLQSSSLCILDDTQLLGTQGQEVCLLKSSVMLLRVAQSDLSGNRSAQTATL